MCGSVTRQSNRRKRGEHRWHPGRVPAAADPIAVTEAFHQLGATAPDNLEAQDRARSWSTRV